MYHHVGISNAKFWRRGHCPAPTPDARYFASQWNIGFTVPLSAHPYPPPQPHSPYQCLGRGLDLLFNPGPVGLFCHRSPPSRFPVPSWVKGYITPQADQGQRGHSVSHETTWTRDFRMGWTWKWLRSKR